jgi:hypothetical protein
MKKVLFALAMLGFAFGASAQTPQPQTPHAPKAPTLQTFATPEEAANAMTEALRKDDEKATAAMLGASWREFVSGNKEDEDQTRADYLKSWDEAHKIKPVDANKVLIEVGTTGFTMPIPIVKQGDRWHFDVEAGHDELIARQIGRNELRTIQTMLAIVDAQRDYAAMDPMKTGVATYARRLLSTPGQKDGLYWENKPGEPESPLGDLVAKAQPGEEGYYGYRYRLLYGQGANAPGGAYSYLVNGRMIGGFAVIAWPVHYGETGVSTFISNFAGDVYEQDLGPDTAVKAGNIAIYDPDKSWEKSDTTP